MPVENVPTVVNIKTLNGQDDLLHTSSVLPGVVRGGGQEKKKNVAYQFTVKYVRNVLLD